MKRYERLARDLAQSIQSGLLRPGERLPSVRQASTSRKLSPATVFKAYYLLEAQGLITARERSGYYVAQATDARRLPPEPELSRPVREESVPLDISEHVFSVLESARDRAVVPLGSAFPSPLLFPLPRLARVTAASVQKLDPWAAIDDLTPGSAVLRRQIALRYLTNGTRVHTDDIVITNGAMEALNLCLDAVTRPGDAVLVESPTFYAALQVLERNGLQAVEVPTHPREGADLEAMERMILRHRPRACWLMTTFQNPLGSLMPDARKRELVLLLARHDIPLIEDDVYGELYFTRERPASAKTYDQHGLVMHCSSFSKCLAPGYRIGWAAPGRYAREVARLKLTRSLATAAPAQAALAAYLEKGGYDRHLRQLRQTLAAQQERMRQTIARHFPPGTRVTRPQGGYFVWVEMPEAVDALELHRLALAQDISLAPGPIFSAQRGFGNCIRLNYGQVWDARLEMALATLGRLAHAFV